MFEISTVSHGPTSPSPYKDRRGLSGASPISASSLVGPKNVADAQSEELSLNAEGRARAPVQSVRLTSSY